MEKSDWKMIILIQAIIFSNIALCRTGEYLDGRRVCSSSPLPLPLFITAASS